MEWTVAQIERVREMASAGYHARYIAGEMGVGVHYLQGVFARTGIRIKHYPRFRPVGAGAPHSAGGWALEDWEDLPDA